MSWPKVKLGDCCEVIMGQSPPGSSYSTDNIGMPLLNGAADFKSDGLHPKKWTTQPKKISKIGDVVLCIRATIGKATISDKEYCLGRGVAALRPDPEIDISYLICVVSSNIKQLDRFLSGSTIKGVRKEHLESINFSLPPLEEQRRIAAILDKATEVEREAVKFQEMRDEIIQATFLDMFGDPVLNPRGWDKKPLNDLVTKLGDGLHGTPKYSDEGDYYFINGNNLVDGKIIINGNTKKVSEDEYLKHRKNLTKSTMLVSINGTIGKVAFYRGERIILGKSACYFNVKESDINIQYLYHLINSHYFIEYASSKATGSTIRNISLKSMREFPIPTPSKDLQNQFADIVRQITAMDLSALETQATTLKQSLTQELLA